MLAGGFNVEESEPCLSQVFYECNAMSKKLSTKTLVLKMH